MRKATLRPMNAIALAVSQEKAPNTDGFYGNTTAKFGRSSSVRRRKASLC